MKRSLDIRAQWLRNIDSTGRSHRKINRPALKYKAKMRLKKSLIK